MRFGAAIVRRAAPLAAVAAAATLLALLPARHLRFEADLPSLLPEGSRAADDYRVFLRTFGGLEKVFVLVEAPPGTDREALADAAFRLSEALEASPEVRSARAGPTSDDERFVLEEIAPRAPLTEPPEDVAAAIAPGAIEERVEALRRALASPAGGAVAALAAADPLGLAAERLEREGSGADLPLDPETGAFLSADGRAALVVVTPSRAETDAEGGRALRAAIEAASAAIPFEVRATGGPLYAAHDEQAIREDLSRVSGGAVLAVGALLLFVCGGLAIPLAAALAVACGLAWTAAATALGLGSVTAIGVGFGAILIGMGDDYVNHLGADYREGVLGGKSRPRAMATALRRAAPGTIASAVTTSAAFAVLSFAHFRPLRELGIVVAIGMGCMLAAAYLVAGPVLALVLRRPPGAVGARGWRALGAAVDAIVGAATRRPRAALAIALLATAAIAPGLSRLSFDPDPRRLRPDDHPGVEAATRLSRSFGVAMETTTFVVRGTDLPQALDRADALASRLRREIGDRGVVRTPSDWLVAGDRLERRREALSPSDPAGAAARLEAALDRAGLRSEPFRTTLDALRALAPGAGAPAFPPRELWPDWLRDAVRETEAETSVAVHLRHATSLAGWAQGPPEALLRDLGDVAVASVPRVGAELRRVALADLRRLGGLSLAVVFVAILLSFRGRLVPAVLSLLPALLGACWTFGLWGWLGRPIDLFALAVIPILVGLGDDHGLHVVHRAASRPRDGLTGAAAGSGRAMVLSTLTTCAGFASLLLSAIPGLRDGGLLVAIGVGAGLLAALVVLPAIGALREAAGFPEKPHAPEGGAARRLLGRFHVTGVFWFRFHLFGVRYFAWAAPVGVPLFTALFWLVLRRIRVAVASNLEAALGPCGALERERRLFRTFLAFAWCQTERYENLAGASTMAFEVEGVEHWREVADAGRGFVVLTAHVGNWEAGSMLPASRFERPVHVVREEELDPRAQAFVSGLLASRGAVPYVTHFASDDPSLGLRLVDALRRGEIVALQGDRPREGGRAIDARLFGRPYPLPSGVPALARAAEVPLLPVFVLREGRRRYRLLFRPPIRFAAGGSRAESERAFAERLAADLEHAIGRAPDQWFCFRRLWPRP